MAATLSLHRSPAAKREMLSPAARLGLSARAFLYLLIGVLALLVATGHSTAETDQSGALQQLNRDSLGHLVIWAVAIGLAGYALWRFSEVFFGAAGDGRKVGARLKSLGRALVYSFFAVNTFQVALGGQPHSQAARQETLTAQVMRHSGGRLLVGLAGAVVVGIGLVLIFEGISRKFEKYLAMGEMSHATRRVVRALGVFGTAARGAVFGLAGVLVIEAAWSYQPQKAAGIDGALRELRDHAAGPWLLGAAAFGLIAFGLYGFAEARWRRT